MFLSRKIFKPDSEEVVILAYCLLVLVQVLNMTQFKNVFGWVYVTRGSKCLSMSLVILSFLMKKTITKKVFYISCILSAAGIGIALASDRLSEVMLVVAFFAAGWHIKSDRIFQRYIRMVISAVLFTLLLYISGIYYYDVIDSDGRTRLYLGFMHITYLANWFFHILLVYFVVKKRKINVWETIAIILINYIIWILTDTRATYYGIYLFLLLLWGLKLFPRIYQSRIFIAASLGVMPILTVLIIYVSYIYTPSNAFLLMLNKILTTRLSLGHEAIEKYGFTLFGSKTVWVTGRYGIERTEAYTYVDSSYLNILLSFGLITLLLVVVGFLIMGRIDPVESIGVSQQRNGNALNVKPPAMRVRDGCYTKNHLSVIIEVFRPLLEKGKVISWQSKQIRSHIRSGCVSTTSSSPPSIDEKLSIINTKQICGIS